MAMTRDDELKVIPESPLNMAPRALGELVEDGRVHRSLYVDESIFERELDQIFSGTWVYVGHESEIPSPDDYKTTTIGRHPVIVTRLKTGTIRVLYNRCSHRATTVCQQARGNSKFFRCNYHGWTYKSSGECVGVTFPDGYPEDTDKRRFDLVAVSRVDTYRGLIFASVTDQVPTLLDHLGNAREFIDLKMDAAPDGVYDLRSRPSRYYANINWKIQMENSVDAYHGTFVHKSFLELQPRNLGGDEGVDVAKEYGQNNPSYKNLAIDLGNGHSMLDSRPGSGDAILAFTKGRPGGKQYWDLLVDNLGVERATEAVRGGTDAINLEIFPNLVLIANQLRVVHP